MAVTTDRLDTYTEAAWRAEHEKAVLFSTTPADTLVVNLPSYAHLQEVADACGARVTRLDCFGVGRAYIDYRGVQFHAPTGEVR